MLQIHGKSVCTGHVVKPQRALCICMETRVKLRAPVSKVIQIKIDKDKKNIE